MLINYFGFASFAAFSTACPPAFTSLPAPSTVFHADSESTPKLIRTNMIAFICVSSSSLNAERRPTRGRKHRAAIQRSVHACGAARRINELQRARDGGKKSVHPRVRIFPLDVGAIRHRPLREYRHR